MGVIKSHYGQKQQNFKKRIQIWQTDGDVVVRILPVSDKFTTDPYKWIQYHSVVKGYKNSEGKIRMFESTLNKKKGEIVTPDAAVERFEQLKAAYAKAVTDGNGALAKQLNDLIGMRGVYSVEKKYFMNVITLEGAVGTFGINYTQKAMLDVEINKLNASGIDPLSLENGRYFVFNKTLTSAKPTYSVNPLQEEIHTKDYGKVKKDVVGKDLTDSWANIEREMSDLDKLYFKITPEEIAEIVKESDLKTGKSPACDRIFDAKWKAEKEARKLAQSQPQAAQATLTPLTQSNPEDNEEDHLHALDEVLLKSVPTLVKDTPKQELPHTEAPLANLDEQSDADFFAQIGVKQ